MEKEVGERGTVERSAGSIARRPAWAVAFFLVLAQVSIGLVGGFLCESKAATAAILGWNNLGMHCMDADFSVFSILPPYNTIEAQLIVGGKLVKSGSGYTVTYQAVADPAGSTNTTSIGKTNFYTWAKPLYGATLAPDAGLLGWKMPGAGNPPQSMLFETMNQPASGVFAPANWFRAEGIPITPYDDAGKKNPYPLMRLVAKNSSGTVVATSDVVLPVSDEMDCSACHSSAEGYRYAILDAHDRREFARDAAAYTDALGAKKYDLKGLYATAKGGTPVLCAGCHASEALGAPSYGSIPALTTSMHSFHATVADPLTGASLGSSENRTACYRCHPGSATKCLRGAMGSAVAADGSMAMQCQSCHGDMATVGASNRVGWFMEPNCQSCHTGTATSNNGQIRYTSVFDSTGAVRVPVNNTFATNPDTPAAGLSLYRFSSGHGGLQCSACHGSTHAEFPSSHGNDNIRNVQLQGHAGVTIECTACHTTTPSTASGGPHGMHPIGSSWVSGHHDMISAAGGVAACQGCHGTDYRGTVLSRAQGDRAFVVGDARIQVNLFRGATVGCYTCHNGPGSSTMNTSAAPVVTNVSAKTLESLPVNIPLSVSPSTATLRIVSQPANGTVGLTGTTATYYPADGFAGTDTFTFAAYDGAKNSTLATGTVVVDPNPPPTISGFSPTSGPVGTTVAIAGTYLSGAFSVSLNGVTAKFSVASAGQINAVVPAGATTGKISVTTPGGSVTSTGTFTVVLPPAIAGFSPSTGSVGSTVTVTGSGFAGATNVRVNGTSAAYTVASDSQVTLSVPTGATSGPVSVTTAAGTATSATPFTVTAGGPTISSFSPTYGGVGRAVTITGTNFTGATKVTLNGSSATFTVVSPTSIVFGVPAGATSGRISVTTANGTATSASSFSVSGRNARPTVTSFTPTSGKVGTAVTVAGSNLGAATSAVVGAVGASFRVLSASQIVITVPTGATTGRISVSTPGGSATSSGSFTVN